MQYKIEPTNNLDKREAKHIFGGLQKNYGLAGGIYAQYLTQNLEEVIDLAMNTQAIFDTRAKIDTRERFWSGMAAANLTGGLIAKKLGLHNIDTKRVFDWAVNEIVDMQGNTQLHMEDYGAVIGEFLLKYNPNILVINRHSTSKSGIAATPIVNPRNSIMVRYEPDTRRIYIIRTALRGFCVDKQVTFNDLLDRLSRDGSYLATVRVRLDIGTDTFAPPVEALEFDSDLLGIAPPTADVS
jgi:hypothetical protein